MLLLFILYPLLYLLPLFSLYNPILLNLLNPLYKYKHNPKRSKSIYIYALLSISTYTPLLPVLYYQALPARL